MRCLGDVQGSGQVHPPTRNINVDLEGASIRRRWFQKVQVLLATRKVVPKC